MDMESLDELISDATDSKEYSSVSSTKGIKIPDIDGVIALTDKIITIDGVDLTTYLKDIKDNLKIDAISPKELIGSEDYDIPTKVASLNTGFISCMEEVKKYFDMVKAIDGSIKFGRGVGGNSGEENYGDQTLQLTDDILEPVVPGVEGSTTITIPDSGDSTVIGPTIVINPSGNGSSNNNNGNSSTNNNSGSTSLFKPSEDNGMLIVSQDGGNLVDENGNVVGTVKAGKYQIYKIKRDANGKTIAVRISKDGESEVWINIDQDNFNGVVIETSNTGTYTIQEGSLNVYDANGNIIGKIGPGNHKVYGVIYGEDGKIVSIRISKDGMDECWVNVNEGNTTGVMAFEGQDGTYNLSNGTLDIYDANGNLVGKLIDGEYVVYDVKYDANGNVTSIRISKDGQTEQWVNIYENGNYTGTYTPVGGAETIVLQNNSGKLDLFGKGTLIVGGIIGVLAIATGAGMYIKNKKGEKVSEIDEGDYGVYDVVKDESGNVTDARITPEGEEEYWVHV